MVQARLNAEALSQDPLLTPDKRHIFRSAMVTLEQYMTPTERGNLKEILMRRRAQEASERKNPSEST